LPIAVKDDAAWRGDFFGPLLLMLSALLELAVREDLQVNQAETDCAAPENEDPSQAIEAEIGAAAGGARSHGISSDKYGGRLAALLKTHNENCHFEPARRFLRTAVRNR
jgi:hypothetical protein